MDQKNGFMPTGAGTVEDIVGQVILVAVGNREATDGPSGKRLEAGLGFDDLDLAFLG